MKTTILSPAEYTTSLWSGGSTTQLYIFPSSASYLERNFDIRISTAQVKAKTSTFTQLLGVSRKLMILEGKIEISHQDHHSKKLKPFDVDIFSGNWKTSAKGICTDFNVMTTGQTESELYHLYIEANEQHVFESTKTCKKLLLFAFSGCVEIVFTNEKYLLQIGRLMIIENINKAEIKIQSKAFADLVVVEVYELD